MTDPVEDPGSRRTKLLPSGNRRVHSPATARGARTKTITGKLLTSLEPKDCRGAARKAPTAQGTITRASVLRSELLRKADESPVALFILSQSILTSPTPSWPSRRVNSATGMPQTYNDRRKAQQ